MRRDDRTTNTKPHSFPPIATESYTTQRERRNAILIRNPKRRKPELQAEDAQMVERKAETRRETWTPHMDVPRDGATQLRSSSSLRLCLCLSLCFFPSPPRFACGPLLLSFKSGRQGHRKSNRLTRWTQAPGIGALKPGIGAFLQICVRASPTTHWKCPSIIIIAYAQCSLFLLLLTEIGCFIAAPWHGVWPLSELRVLLISFHYCTSCLVFAILHHVQSQIRL